MTNFSTVRVSKKEKKEIHFLCHFVLISSDDGILVNEQLIEIVDANAHC